MVNPITQRRHSVLTWALFELRGRPITNPIKEQNFQTINTLANLNALYLENPFRIIRMIGDSNPDFFAEINYLKVRLYFFQDRHSPILMTCKIAGVVSPVSL